MSGSGTAKCDSRPLDSRDSVGALPRFQTRANPGWKDGFLIQSFVTGFHPPGSEPWIPLTGLVLLSRWNHNGRQLESERDRLGRRSPIATAYLQLRAGQPCNGNHSATFAYGWLSRWQIRSGGAEQARR